MVGSRRCVAVICVLGDYRVPCSSPSRYGIFCDVLPLRCCAAVGAFGFLCFTIVNILISHSAYFPAIGLPTADNAPIPGKLRQCGRHRVSQVDGWTRLEGGSVRCAVILMDTWDKLWPTTTCRSLGMAWIDSHPPNTLAACKSAAQGCPRQPESHEQISREVYKYRIDSNSTVES